MIFARQRDYLLRVREISALLVVFTSKMLALLPIFASQKSTYLEDFHVRSTSERPSASTNLLPPGGHPGALSGAAGPPPCVSTAGQTAHPLVRIAFGAPRAL